MKEYKTGIGNLPKPLQIFLSGTIRFGGKQLDLKRNIKVIEAANFDEFNEIATKFEASAQRIKQTKPFIHFYFVAFHMPNIDENNEIIDEPILIFQDLGSDGIEFAIHGDITEVQSVEL